MLTTFRQNLADFNVTHALASANPNRTWADQFHLVDKESMATSASTSTPSNPSSNYFKADDGSISPKASSKEISSPSSPGDSGLNNPAIKEEEKPRMLAKVPPLNLGGENDNSSALPLSQAPKSARSTKTKAQPAPTSPRSLRIAPQPKSLSARVLTTNIQGIANASGSLTSSPNIESAIADHSRMTTATGSLPATTTTTTTTTNITTTTTTTTTTNTANSKSGDERIFGTSSEPVFRIVREKMQVPSSLLKKNEIDYVPNMLGDMIVDEICKGELLPDQLHKIGRMPTAYRRERLPRELQALAKQFPNPAVSSTKLLQALFADDFKKNAGWCRTRTNCELVISDVARQGKSIEIGQNDPQIAMDEKKRLASHARNIARNIFHEPGPFNKSALPERLLNFLSHCDQHFHERLMHDIKTRQFTTMQMRDARIALQKQLLVTYLLQPMLTNLVSAAPSQSEIWFLGQLLKSMLDAVPPIFTQIFDKSYANSPKQFQQAVTEKQKQEKLQQIRAERTASFRKKPGGHQRSRSADVKLVNPESLPTREQMQTYRAAKKSEVLAKELEKNARKLDRVLAEVEKNVKESEALTEALGDLQNFDEDELATVLSILEDRDVKDAVSVGGTVTTTDTRDTSTPTDTDQASIRMPIPTAISVLENPDTSTVFNSDNADIADENLGIAHDFRGNDTQEI